MRNLADWEGKMVRVEGYVQKFFVKDFGKAVLLEPVKIKTFNDSDPIRHIDHLWVYDKRKEEWEQQMEEMKKEIGVSSVKPDLKDTDFFRLDKIMLIGKVEKYKRKNGQEDYGVEHYISLDFKAATDRLKHFYEIRRYEVCLNVINVVASALEKEFLFIPLETSVEEGKKIFEQCKKQIQLMIENEKKQNEKQHKKNINIRKRKTEWMLLAKQSS